MTSRPLRLAFAGFALLGLAVTAAYVLDRRARSADSAAVARAPPSAPAAVAPGSTLRIPAERPEFTLTGTDGRVHSAHEWDGKSLVVNFWATWCAPCRREIPLLNRLRRDYAPNGVAVLGIAVDFRDDVLAFQKRVPIDYPLLVGEQDGLDAARAFGVDSMLFPFTAFTDSKGRVLTVHVGELHEAEARAILAVVGQVDAGQLTPVEAREEIRTRLAALRSGPAPRTG